MSIVFILRGIVFMGFRIFKGLIVATICFAFACASISKDSSNRVSDSESTSKKVSNPTSTIRKKELLTNGSPSPVNLGRKPEDNKTEPVAKRSEIKNDVGWTVERLRVKIREKDYGEILEAGKVGNSELTPYLESLLKSGNENVKANSRLALARMGNRKYLNEILAEIDSPDPNINIAAFSKLEYIGTKQAIRKLHSMLDDTNTQFSIGCQSCRKIRTRCRDGKEKDEGKCPQPPFYCQYRCDQPFFSKSALSIFHLSRIVDDPPSFPKDLYDSSIDMAGPTRWKNWFDKNRHLID